MIKFKIKTDVETPSSEMFFGSKVSSEYMWKSLICEKRSLRGYFGNLDNRRVVNSIWFVKSSSIKENL